MELLSGIAAIASIITYLGLATFEEVRNLANWDAALFLENNAAVESMDDKAMVVAGEKEKELLLHDLIKLVNQKIPFDRLMKSQKPLRIFLKAVEMEHLRSMMYNQKTLRDALGHAMQLMSQHFVLSVEDTGALAKVQVPQLQQFLMFLLHQKIIRIESVEGGGGSFVVDLPLFQKFLAHLRGDKPEEGGFKEISYGEDMDREVPSVPVVSASDSDDEIMVVVPVAVPEPEEPMAAAETSALEIDSSATANTVSAALLVGIALVLL